MAYQFKFQLGNREYLAEVPENLGCYKLLKKKYGFYQKVPCRTDAEERQFPHDAGWVATAYLQGLRDKSQAQ